MDICNLHLTNIFETVHVMTNISMQDINEVLYLSICIMAFDIGLHLKVKSMLQNIQYLESILSHK